MTRARGWYYWPRAAEDATAISAHLVLAKGSPRLAMKFVASLESSLDRVIEQPDAGPP